jgi:hypothetical protein
VQQCITLQLIDKEWNVGTFKRSRNANLARRAGITLMIFAGFVSGGGTCWGCDLPPREQIIDVDEQIWFAEDVSVAKVVRATATTGEQVEYEFLVQKRITGVERFRFTIVGIADQEQGGTDFAGHSDKAFWLRGGGRLFNNTACVIEPSFALGASYLVFLGEPISRRSFERIDATNGQVNSGDKWLAYVEAKLGTQAQSR